MGSVKERHMKIHRRLKSIEKMMEGLKYWGDILCDISVGKAISQKRKKKKAE